MPETAQEELDYVFRGLGTSTTLDATGKGTSFVDDTDRGSGSSKAKPSVSTGLGK